MCATKRKESTKKIINFSVYNFILFYICRRSDNKSGTKRISSDPLRHVCVYFVLKFDVLLDVKHNVVLEKGPKVVKAFYPRDSQKLQGV